MTHAHRLDRHSPRAQVLLPAAVAGGRRPRGTSAVVALGVVGAVTALARIPVDLWDSLYAEDGQVFLSDWAHGGTSLLAPYAGYLHLLPRLVSGLVSLLPVEWWAGATTVAVCALTGAVCAGVAASTRTVVRTTPVWVAVSLAPVLVPSVGTEALGALADFHLYCLILLTVMTAAPARRTPRGAVGVTALVAVLVLTEVQALVLAPLVVWMAFSAWRVRTVERLDYVLGWSLGALGQVGTLLLVAGTRSSGTVPVDVPDGVRGYLANVLLGSVVGTGGRAGTLVRLLGWGTLTVAALGLLVLVAWTCLVRSTGPDLARFLPLTALSVGAVSWAASYGLNAVHRFDDPDRLLLFRWGSAGAVLLAVAVLVTVDRLDRRRLTAVVLAGALAAAATGFPAALPFRRGVTPWSESVAALTSTCQADPDAVVRIPTPQPPGRYAAVPCHLVLGAG